MILFGFDPGGKGNFGWARLHISEDGKPVHLFTGVVSDASAAVSGASQGAENEPDGVGIDAPLYWVFEGDRCADAHIRNRVVAAGGHSGSVNAVNSLRGACLVQGVLAARLVLSKWPSTLITEAHPKALLRLDAESSEIVLKNLREGAEEHERDAALAAFAAWAAISRRETWSDLVKIEKESEKLFFPSGSQLTYWFPK
jgi:hypothetical protein